MTRFRLRIDAGHWWWRWTGTAFGRRAVWLGWITRSRRDWLDPRGRVLPPGGRRMAGGCISRPQWRDGATSGGSIFRKESRSKSPLDRRKRMEWQSSRTRRRSSPRWDVRERDLDSRREQGAAALFRGCGDRLGISPCLQPGCQRSLLPFAAGGKFGRGTVANGGGLREKRCGVPWDFNDRIRYLAGWQTGGVYDPCSRRSHAVVDSDRGPKFTRKESECFGCSVAAFWRRRPDSGPADGGKRKLPGADQFGWLAPLEDLPVSHRGDSSLFLRAADGPPLRPPGRRIPAFPRLWQCRWPGEPRSVFARPLCLTRWSTDGKFLFVSVEDPSRTSPGRSLAIPVGPGESLPVLPVGGIAPLIESRVVQGAVSVGRGDLVPGKDPEHYAWVNTTVHRNLYQISLP